MPSLRTLARFYALECLSPEIIQYASIDTEVGKHPAKPRSTLAGNDEKTLAIRTAAVNSTFFAKLL